MKNANLQHKNLRKKKYCDLNKAADIEDLQTCELCSKARFQLKQIIKIEKCHYYCKLIKR